MPTENRPRPTARSAQVPGSRKAQCGLRFREDHIRCYQLLTDKLRVIICRDGIDILSHVVEDDRVNAIVDFLRRQKADLLVVGLHQRDLKIARLWSTVYELAQEARATSLAPIRAEV